MKTLDGPFRNDKGKEVDPKTYKKQLYKLDENNKLVPVCGGKVPHTTRYCNNVVIPQDRVHGITRCACHGANLTSNFNKGNQNSVKHGAYSMLYKSKLDKNEQNYFETCKVDNLQEIEEQIKLSNVRIARLLANIDKFNAELLMDKLSKKRSTELYEWIDKTERQLNIIQRNLNYQLMSKAELEKELNLDENVAQQNRKNFIDALNYDVNLFERE